MAYIPPNPNGQATSANSAPVVIASDQSAVPVNTSTLAGTTVATGAGVITAGTQRVTIATDQAAVPSNQTQLNGVAIAVGSGTSSTGTQRVILATDQPVIPANQAQVNGVAVATGAGVNSTGTQRVTIATDQAAIASNQTQVNGVAIAVGSGVTSTGTPRVTIATDDVNLAAINTTTAAVNTKTPTLGRQAASASSPVTLCDEDITDVFVTGQSAQTATVNNILTPTAGAAATDVGKYRSFAIQVVSTATGGNYTFEGSNDNINFGFVPVKNQALGTGAFTTGAIAPTSGTIIWVGSCAQTYLRLRINANLTGGSIQTFSVFSPVSYADTSQIIGNSVATNLLTTVTPTTSFNFAKPEDQASVSADVLAAIAVIRNDLLTSNVSASGDYAAPTCDIYGNLVVKDQQRHKATYRTAFVVAPAATATDIFQLIGSATKTVEITRIRIAGTQITTGQVVFYIKKRSTANTGGTSSAATLVPLLSTDAAATAVGAIYTANPTTGTTVGDVAVRLVPVVAAASLGDQEIAISFGELGRALILSGTAQAIAINLNGVTITSGSLVITIEFTEY